MTTHKQLQTYNVIFHIIQMSISVPSSGSELGSFQHQKRSCGSSECRWDVRQLGNRGAAADCQFVLNKAGGNIFMGLLMMITGSPR